MIDTSNIFKEFEEKDISEASLEVKDSFGWIFPDLRDEQDRLTKFGLRPYRPRFDPDDPIPQLEPGNVTGRYFFKVYDRTNVNGIQLSDQAKYSQFTVTYGNKAGLGPPVSSLPSGEKMQILAKNRPSQSIYEQYVNSLLPQRSESFPEFERDHFYAINLNRRTFQKEIRKGHWEVTLAFEGKGPQNGVQLVDKTIEDSSLKEREQIEVVPGNLKNGVNSSPPSEKTYGYLYSKKGIIILNPDALSDHAKNVGNIKTLKNITPETRTPSEILNSSGSYEVEEGTTSEGKKVYRFTGGLTEKQANEKYPDWPFFRNHSKLFYSIKNGESFRLQVKREVIDVVYTVILDQTEGNFSFNPTYSDEDGNITFPDSPGTYPTAIGLYDDDYKLLAVAKVSPPKEKDPETGLAADVRLNF